MEKEVFEGRSRTEFVDAILRLRAEGREDDAARVEDLLVIRDLREGKLDTPQQR